MKTFSTLPCHRHVLMTGSGGNPEDANTLHPTGHRKGRGASARSATSYISARASVRACVTREPCKQTTMQWRAGLTHQGCGVICGPF